MTKPYVQIVPTADVFQTWLDRTNNLLDDMTNIVVTADSSVAGSTTVGNTHLVGNLDAVILSVSSGIRGGTNVLGAPLNILFGASVNGPLSVTGATTLQNSVTITGGTLTVNVPATFTSTITGSIATANTLATVRNITLTGPVTGTTTFNGSADAIIATTLAPTALLSGILSLDGAGSGLDADLLDGFHANTFIQNTGNSTIAGTLTATNLTTPTATISDGTNTWTISLVGGDLTISYAAVPMFKLSKTGNLVVKGDITAFGVL